MAVAHSLRNKGLQDETSYWRRPWQGSSLCPTGTFNTRTTSAISATIGCGR